MLVLSRYRDESIYIGDDIVVTIVDVRGDRVRLGIQAPPNVSVHRQEIYEAIAREKKGGVQERSPQSGYSGSPEKSTESKSSSVPPLEQKLTERRNKALPIDIDTPSVGFGGISDVVTGG